MREDMIDIYHVAAVCDMEKEIQTFIRLILFVDFSLIYYWQEIFISNIFDQPCIVRRKKKPTIVHHILLAAPDRFCIANDLSQTFPFSLIFSK
jgi:hypothetical protein